MALIPKLSTGLPTPKNVLLRQNSVNRSDTTAKNLFILRKGSIPVAMTFYGNLNSNAGTTATLSLGAKLLDNSAASVTPLYGVYMTSLGSGYTSAPTVTFSGGGGSTQATGTAIINSSGQVIGIKINTYGVGYTSAPSIAFSGGGGSGAAATAVVISATTFHAGIDVKTASTGSGQQYVQAAAALYIPAPFDVMVTGTYAETGAASTTGGPWFIQFNTYQPGPGEAGALGQGGFYPAA